MSEFRIKTIVVGPVSTNCFFLYLENNKEAVIVDPGDEPEVLQSKIKELGIEPVAILLTHGHFDHIIAVDALREAYGCKVYCGQEEMQLLEKSQWNMSAMPGRQPVTVTAEEGLVDGQVIELAGMKFQVITTPGHTKGCVCYYIEKEQVLISGDTLFEESLGRTDLPTAEPMVIIDSISKKLFPLPEDTMVYPGHGNPTTIGHERQHNPVAHYLKRKQD